MRKSPFANGRDGQINNDVDHGLVRNTISRFHRVVIVIKEDSISAFADMVCFLIIVVFVGVVLQFILFISLFVFLI